MTTIRAFIKGHPLLSYYALVFIISWGGFLLVGGPGIFAGTNWQTDPLFPLAVAAMLLGPPVAGILLTSFVSGSAGYRELLSLIASSISSFGLVPPAISGVPFLTLFLVFTAALWVVVAAVAVANGGHLSRQPLRRRVA
jgi:hypothetical protein